MFLLFFQLRRLMNEVDALKNEREVIESELKNATFSEMKNKFLSALAADGAINEGALSAESLGEVYGPLQKQIRESKARQEKLLTDVQRVNNDFVQLKSTSTSGNSQRENFLSELAAAHDAFMELLGNLEEGTKFYNDLTQLLVNLQNKVGDFCFARKAEREELCKDMQNAIVSSSNPQAPPAPAYHTPTTAPSDSRPARPPPPSSTPSSQPNLPFAQPYAAPNPYAPYYYPPPPLPTGYNPYAAPQPQPNYGGYGQNQPAGHGYAPPPTSQGQPNYPYPQQPPPQQQGYPGYPYPQQPPRY